VAGVVRKNCPICSGKKSIQCENCYGRGSQESRRSRYDAEGRVLYETERNSCTTCAGTGKRMCYACSGVGYNLVPGDPEDTDEIEPDAEESEWDDRPRTAEEYGELSRGALASAESERSQLLSWLWNDSAFATDFKSNFDNWLSGLDLSGPGAEAALKGTADQWNAPGKSAQVDNLLLRMRGLASWCGMADLYRSMAGG
jgi:hypothetical protein